MTYSQFLRRALFLSSALLLFIAAKAPAGSATWNLNPASDSWNSAANWTPAIVPNGPSDTATFGISNTNSIALSANVEVNGIIYNTGASAFTTNVPSSQVLTVSGSGITNNSGLSQNFSVGVDPAEIIFTNSATSGTQTSFTTAGGVSNLTGGGQVIFFDDSAALESTFVNNGGTVSGAFGGLVGFTDNANAGNVVITNSSRGTPAASGGGKTKFSGSATADHATITNLPNGEPIASGGGTEFVGHSNAGECTITNEGATVSGEIGGSTDLENNSSAANATIICNGGQIAGAGGGIVRLRGFAQPGLATLIANGGVHGGEGGKIQLFSGWVGGLPRVEVFGNGLLQLVPGLTRFIGSLEGDGLVELTDAGLEIGGNLSTTFSGSIRGSGTLFMIGNGSLTLSGRNAYGLTSVQGGTLIVNGTTGSGPDSDVTVGKGTLGGSGIIPGRLFIGNGDALVASLAPAAGTDTQSVLTVEQLLSFSSDGIYIYTFKAKGQRARTDLVVANGVALQGAPTIDLQGSVQGTLAIGLVLTVFSNTSANAISGEFGNLPDGAIVTIRSNNFQADYQGGDGNDLTLTVVP